MRAQHLAPYIEAAAARKRKIYVYQTEDGPQSTIHLSMVPFHLPYIVCYPNGSWVGVG